MELAGLPYVYVVSCVSECVIVCVLVVCVDACLFVLPYYSFMKKRGVL